MLKNKKLISIIATLAFCLSFLAPVLLAPPALAADMYSVIKTATVTPSTNAQDIGAVVKVVIPDIDVVSGDRVTVSLPSAWDVGNPVTANTEQANVISVVGAAAANDDDDAKIATATLHVGAMSSNNAFDIWLTPQNGEIGANKYFYIYFNGIDLNNTTGDLTVTFFPPAGSVFQQANVNIGKSSRDGSTYTSIKKVNSVTIDEGLIDIITINEMQAGTLDLDGTITLKILTKGVTWRTAGAAAFGWDFIGSHPGNIQAITAGMISDNELEYPIPADLEAVNGAAGKISFANLAVEIDDEEAVVGDKIQVKISGADMTAITLDVATYADYGVTLKEGTSETIIAGKGDQDVGTFTIEEAAAETLVEGRTIKVSLPKGVKWHGVDGEMETVNDSALSIDNPAAVTGTEEQILLFTVDDVSDDAGKVEFKDFTVDVAPDFVGPVEVTVAGSAGVEGKVKIAEVKPALTISVDSVKDIKLGLPNQALGKITLTEGIAEGLEEGSLVLLLDDTYRWAKEPTVKVTEGNVDIDADVDIDNEILTINIDSTSTNPSKIEISDAYIDAYRTAPEGPIYLKVGDFANDDCTAILGVDDITNGDVEDDWAELTCAKTQVGSCVTPAETTSSNAAFYIGSNIMSVNGSNVIMDASPYIKAGRTYVPVRYLGDALGATTAWDAATKTVTLTKGDKTVVLVIGSQTAKANGADVAMDVAPEINGGRTMLPARYVAEGLGYQVGWNAALQQVIVGAAK